MTVSVTKLTDVELLQEANSSTTGHDSNMTLERAYRYGHSPIRTQQFWIVCKDIPLFVASQLVRSHVGVQFYQRSKRTDRGGADFAERCKRIADKLNVIDNLLKGAVGQAVQNMNLMFGLDETCGLKLKASAF